MNIYDITTKGDLIGLEKRLEEHFASKADLIKLERRMDDRFASKTDLTNLEVRFDLKLDDIGRRIVDDITEVTGDLMQHADARFRRLGKVTGQPEGWQKSIKRTLKPAGS